MSGMKTKPSMKILSPRWHFSLYSSSSSCLVASLVVAGVKEAVQLPLSSMWTKQVKGGSLSCSGYCVSAPPGRWQSLFYLVSLELTRSFVAPC